jgi:hypothetical protein
VVTSDGSEEECGAPAVIGGGGGGGGCGGVIGGDGVCGRAGIVGDDVTSGAGWSWVGGFAADPSAGSTMATQICLGRFGPTSFVCPLANVT